jgi:hypothetical protein
MSAEPFELMKSMLAELRDFLLRHQFSYFQKILYTVPFIYFLIKPQAMKFKPQKPDTGAGFELGSSEN